MAKFCTGCGAPLDDAAKFCMSCGTPSAQPQPEPQPQPQPQPEPEAQQYQQPPQQQYQQPQQFQPPQYQQPQYQQQPQQPAAKPKKKGKGLKVFLCIVGVFAVLIASIALLMGKASRMDYYKLMKDQIPSVKLALGEKRKVTGAGTKIENGMNIKNFSYSSDTPQEDIDAYYAYLLDKAGYIRMYDPDTMEFSSVGHNSVTPGNHIEVIAETDSGGYVVTLYYAKGEIQMINTDDKGEDKKKSDDYEAPTDSYQTPATQASSGGSLSKSVINMFAGGTYHIKMKTESEDANAETELYVKGGKMAMLVNAEGTDMRMVYKDDKCYSIIPEYEMVSVMEIPGGASAPTMGDTDSLSFVGEGSGEFDGAIYRYDEYRGRDGAQLFYYMDGGAWKGTRTVEDGKTTNLIVRSFDTNVPDSIFDVPDDYQIISGE